MTTNLLQEPTSDPAPEASSPVKLAQVLHVINGEHYAGAERVQDLLSEQLPKLGYEVGLACIKPGEFPSKRRNRDAPLFEIPMRGRFDLMTARRLARLVRLGDYQLLHAHTPRSVLVAGMASLITGVPMIYHVHSPTSRDSTHRFRNVVNAGIERVGLFWASALIAVSHSLGRHVQGLGVSADKIWVVPNGVPSRPAIPARSSDKQTWTLGTVALFRPRKGTEVLLRALAELSARGLSVRLRAVGGFETPEYERRIKGLAEELDVADAIEWTGFTTDVDAELAQMDLFVLPSLFGEGLPMVILEAMASGLPVVATDVEGVPEAIRDGQDGLIARADDAGSLAAAIGRIVRGELDWARLRANARQRQAESFSDRSMAAGVAEVYEKVLSAG